LGRRPDRCAGVLRSSPPARNRRWVRGRHRWRCRSSFPGASPP